MVTINPTGMGYKTSRQFRRVCDDMIKYANSVYVYDELDSAGDQWYDSHSTMRGGNVKRATRLHDTRSPTVYPTHVPTPSSSIIGRRDRRNPSR